MFNIDKGTLTKFSLWMLALIAQGIVASTGALATDYYVAPAPTGSDGNPGTASRPWATIQHAATTMVAGDTAIVTDGVYTEPQIVFARSGTATQPITVRAQNKHGAILSSTSGCNANISLFASYIVLEDLVSQISPLNITCSILSSASGAAVRAWAGYAPYTVPDASAPNTPFSHCVIRGMRVDPSPARGVGIKTNQDYCLVENNEIYSSLEAYNNIGNVFRNNEVYGHDIWGAALFGKGGVRNFEIYNNVVHISEGTTFGILIGGQSSRESLFDPAAGFEAYNSVAYNNVVINPTGNIVQALGMMSAKDSALFNNIVAGRGYLHLTTSVQPPQTVTENPVIKNNIFSCVGYTVRDTTSYWAYTGTIDLDYNNFYECPDAPEQANAVIGDPLFSNISFDWHVDVLSPVVGAGVPVSMPAYGGGYISVDTDKDGAPRTDNWDLGIYQASGC
jgi:hypothetical protein